MITLTSDSILVIFPPFCTVPVSTPFVLYFTQVWLPRKNSVPKSDTFPLQLHVLTGKVWHTRGQAPYIVVSDHALCEYIAGFKSVSRIHMSLVWSAMVWSNLL
jgi:hypothetical protein